jgi:hypothetical protein
VSAEAGARVSAEFAHPDGVDVLLERCWLAVGNSVGLGHYLVGNRGELIACAEYGRSRRPSVWTFRAGWGHTIESSKLAPSGSRRSVIVADHALMSADEFVDLLFFDHRGGDRVGDPHFLFLFVFVVALCLAERPQRVVAGLCTWVSANTPPKKTIMPTGTNRYPSIPCRFLMWILLDLVTIA